MVEQAIAPKLESTSEDIQVPHVLAVSSITQRLGREWTETARRHRFALASGPSGVGKSILMHQVVVPALRRDDAEMPIIAFMPGDSPLGFFASLWRALGNSAPLPQEPETALIEALASSEKTGCLILVIDGLDQIFANSESEAAQALSFLWNISEQGLATVIGALRCPFREPICRLLPDAAPTSDLFVSLASPAAEDRAILAREGLELVSPELEKTDPTIFKRVIDEIARELDQAPQALTFLKPLLERWQAQVACSDLSVMNWLRSGGLAGEIAVHIDQKFASLKPRLKKQLEPLLKVLVSWTDELSPIPCEVAFKDIEALGDDAVELTNVLLYERVLFLAGDDVHAARVKLIHPALTQQWATAKAILADERRDISARRLLDAQALHWDSNGRRTEDQWLEGDIMLVAQTLLQKEASALPRITHEFLRTFEAATAESDAPMQKLRQMVKPLSLLLVLFAITRGLIVMTHADLGSASSPIMGASAGTSSVRQAEEAPPTPVQAISAPIQEETADESVALTH